MDDNTLDVVNNNGEKETIYVLKYFTIKELSKDYIIYRCFDLSNRCIICNAEIEEKDDEIVLKEIKDEKAKKIISKMVGEMINVR